MTFTATNFTLTRNAGVSASDVPDIATVTVRCVFRLEPGDTFTAKLGAVSSESDPTVCAPEPCESWIEAAYFAHRLSNGRQKALREIAKHYRQYIEDTRRCKWTDERGFDIGYQKRYSSRRGTSAAVINGCKGLAKDGLIDLRHSDGDRDYGEYCSAYIRRISVRAWQYALALEMFERPIGRIDPNLPIAEVVAGLTPKTREAIAELVEWVTKGYGTDYTGEMRVRAPSRKQASTWTAMEKRGFVRWTRKEKGNEDQYGKEPDYWFFRIPAESRILEVAAFVSPKAATALLTEGEE